MNSLRSPDRMGLTTQGYYRPALQVMDQGLLNRIELKAACRPPQPRPAQLRQAAAQRHIDAIDAIDGPGRLGARD